jgi:hypothetical protein
MLFCPQKEQPNTKPKESIALHRTCTQFQCQLRITFFLFLHIQIHYARTFLSFLAGISRGGRSFLSCRVLIETETIKPENASQHYGLQRRMMSQLRAAQKPECHGIRHAWKIALCARIARAVCNAQLFTYSCILSKQL